MVPLRASLEGCITPDEMPQGDCEVWFYVHIPKCAGRTVECHLEASLEPSEFLSIPRRHGVRYYFGKAYEFPASSSPARIRAVSGHYLGQSLGRYFPDRVIRQAVLIRDPVSFIVSLYNYRMQRYQRRGGSQVPFEAWYKTRPCDPISDFLLCRYLEIPRARLWTMTRDQKAKVLVSALDRFDYVGGYKDCSSFLEQISAHMGLPIAHDSKNITPADAKIVKEIDLSHRVLSDIRRSCALDQWLWDTYGNRGWASSETIPPTTLGDHRLHALGRDLVRLYRSAADRSQRGPLD